MVKYHEAAIYNLSDEDFDKVSFSYDSYGTVLGAVLKDIITRQKVVEEKKFFSTEKKIVTVKEAFPIIVKVTDNIEAEELITEVKGKTDYYVKDNNIDAFTCGYTVFNIGREIKINEVEDLYSELLKDKEGALKYKRIIKNIEKHIKESAIKILNEKNEVKLYNEKSAKRVEDILKLLKKL